MVLVAPGLARRHTIGSDDVWSMMVAAGGVSFTAGSCRSETRRLQIRALWFEILTTYQT